MSLSGKFARFRAQSFSDKAFDIVNYALLAIIAFLVIYPLYFIVIASFSDPVAINNGQVTFWVKGFNTDGYQKIFENEKIWRSYANTIGYTVVGTMINLALTMMLAYPLSRKNFCLRKPILFLAMFTMYFSGGLIPTYIVVTSLGLYNSRLAMILPVLCTAYNVMICRSAFEAVPEELFEEASLEGANDFTILTKIAVPLIKPTLAVLTLYYAVARYNDFFNAMLYLGKRELEPLQLFLRKILLLSSSEILQSSGSLTAVAAAAQSTLQIRYVCIVLSVIPILIICPFVQKYLVKGTMLGAVKG